MKIELSTDDIKFIKNAFNYVVLSLDGNKIDNSNLHDIDKCRILGQCFYIMQELDNPINENKMEVNLTPEMKKWINKNQTKDKRDQE